MCGNEVTVTVGTESGLAAMVVLDTQSPEQDRGMTLGIYNADDTESSFQLKDTHTVSMSPRKSPKTSSMKNHAATETAQMNRSTSNMISAYTFDHIH